MIVERLVLTTAESNCYLVGDEHSRQAVIVDPGAEPERILQRLAELDLHPICTVFTHAHWDHVNAAAALASMAPVAMHPADADLLRRAPEVTLARTGQRGPDPPQISLPLEDAQRISIGEHVHLDVMHTPGHTPGSICLLGDGDKVLFSGDTLMPGWVGRTDGPGGDQAAIRISLWQRLLCLPDATLVYAGHLEPTTIGAERRDNPYLNGTLPLR